MNKIYRNTQVIDKTKKKKKKKKKNIEALFLHRFKNV